MLAILHLLVFSTMQILRFYNYIYAWQKCMEIMVPSTEIQNIGTVVTKCLHS